MASQENKQLAIAKQVIFSMIKGRDHTPFDLWITLKKYKGTVYETPHQLKNEDRLNVLHLCIDKSRLNLLATLMHMGWWTFLSREKVPDQSINEHKGRTAHQIAESKWNRKAVDEVSMFTEWENSLSRLMKAARNCDIYEVKHLLKTEVEESHNRDSNNGNALYWAVVGGNLQVFCTLINFNLDHSMLTKKRETLLHVACMLGQHQLVETLVNGCGIDATAMDQNQKTAFDRCAENGDIETLCALMRCRLTPPSSFPVVTAYAGRKKCLKYCFEQLKMDVNSTDKYSRTPIMRAVEGSKNEIAGYLLQNGADLTCITSSGRNLLHTAAAAGNIRLFQMIVAAPAMRRYLKQMLNQQDMYTGVELCHLVRGRDKGRDAWHYVEVARHRAPIFLKKTRLGNVDVTAFGRVLKSGWGVSPQQDAIDEIEELFKSRRLARNGCLDQTPLHIAAFKGNSDVTRLLLENGASVNIRDKFGLTPLMIAASKGNLDLVKELESRGASFNVGGLSAIDIAMQNEQVDMAEYIRGQHDGPQEVCDGLTAVTHIRTWFRGLKGAKEFRNAYGQNDHDELQCLAQTFREWVLDDSATNRLNAEAMAQMSQSERHNNARDTLLEPRNAVAEMMESLGANPDGSPRKDDAAI